MKENNLVGDVSIRHKSDFLWAAPSNGQKSTAEEDPDEVLSYDGEEADSPIVAAY